MTFPVKELIRNRQSVRSFDGRALAVEDRRKMEEYLKNETNPFGIPVEFFLLNKDEHGLSSVVLTGEDLWMAAKVKKVPRHEIAWGYSFEKACLYAQSLGIGTVMLAASLSRQAFQDAIRVQDDEVMPAASPLGYPAEKRSVRESLMRKALKADDRIPFVQTFFLGSFRRPMDREEAGAFGEALELMRWAPSAGNAQPWRAVVDGDAVHFYEKHTMKENPLGDIQKCDVGNALCHFDLVMQENGHEGIFEEKDPGLDLPEKTEYIISYRKVS